MAVNFLEQLVAEWYEYKGYFVRRNVKVGKLAKGGHECELDVVAFHPQTKHLVHLEPSTDASNWETRERRYKKKFDAGLRYIPSLFDGVLTTPAVPEQIAVLVFASKNKTRILGGGQVMHVSLFIAQILKHFASFSMSKQQVPEQFTVLRTLQFVSEYRQMLFPSEARAESYSSKCASPKKRES